MRLDLYQTGTYTPGAPLWKQVAWYAFGHPVVAGCLPFSSLKVAVLRAFGAQIGTGVRIKPGLRVKFPWRLSVGNHSWLGPAWIDNLAAVQIGNHVCISQDAYLCTGSHDWSDTRFALRNEAITIEDGAWIGARAIVGPGVKVGEHAVLTLGSVATKDLQPNRIYAGNPSVPIKSRVIKAEQPAGDTAGKSSPANGTL